MRKRITRVECNLKAKVQLDNVIIVGARILNISLQGAYFELADYCIFQKGDRWGLIITLPQSDISLQLQTAVIHSQSRLVGVRFLQMDDDTMTKLKGLIGILAPNPDKISRETGLLHVE